VKNCIYGQIFKKLRPLYAGEIGDLILNRLVKIFGAKKLPEFAGKLPEFQSFLSVSCKNESRADNNYNNKSVNKTNDQR